MRLRNPSWLVLVLLLGLGACGGGGGGGGGGGNCLPGPGPNYGSIPPDPSAAELQLAADVLALVNQERANAGVAPVSGHAPSAAVAFDYSVDMLQRGFFDHVNPECEDPGVRLTRAGIGWSTYGENIAQGQTTAAQVMSAWMNSPGHRANILNAAFTRLGVGAREAAGSPTTWTQLFSAP